MTALLDANVLVAATVVDHSHHAAARRWLADTTGRVASCPITQGALVRTLVRVGADARAVRSALETLSSNPRHEFWADDVSFLDVRLSGVVGHRQVTDAYLAQLARSRSGRLVTFDRGLASLHTDVAELLEPAGVD